MPSHSRFTSTPVRPPNRKGRPFSAIDEPARVALPASFASGGTPRGGGMTSGSGRISGRSGASGPPTFAVELRALRRAVGVTQLQLAMAASFSLSYILSYIKKLERGDRRPARSTVELLIRALRLDSDEAAGLRMAGRR